MKSGKGYAWNMRGWHGRKTKELELIHLLIQLPKYQLHAFRWSYHAHRIHQR